MKKAQLPSIFSISDLTQCCSGLPARQMFISFGYYSTYSVPHKELCLPLVAQHWITLTPTCWDHLICQSVNCAVSDIKMRLADWQSAPVCSVFLISRNWIASFFTCWALHCILPSFSKKMQSVHTSDIEFLLFFLIKSHYFVHVELCKWCRNTFYTSLFDYLSHPSPLFCHVCLLKYLNSSLFSVANK